MNVRDRKLWSIVAAPLAVAALAVGVAVAVSVDDEPAAGPAPSASVTAPATPTAPEPQPSTRPPSSPPAAVPSVTGPARPWTEIGYVTRAWTSSGSVRVTVDRVQWLTGAAAVAANGGEEPPNGFVIVNDNPKLRTYPVCARATFFGVGGLGNDDDAASVERISAAQFVERARAAAARGTPALVVLRHRSAADPTVVRVHEQYLP